MAGDVESKCAMAELTPRQRAVLRALAQAVKPITQIGKDGATVAVTRTVEAALNNRELLKAKVLDTAPGTAQEIGVTLAATIEHAHLVQVIGRTVVIFRRHPDNPRIRLPSA